MKAAAERAPTRTLSVPGEGGPPPQPEALLLALVNAGGRVALLDASPRCEQALRDAGCDALVLEEAPRPDNASGEALAQFRPSKVLLADAGRRGSTLREILQGIVRVAPAADVVVGFWNGSAASALLDALMGSRRYAAHTVTDAEVRSALAESGFSIASRQGWRAPDTRRFTVDLDRALHQLFVQLNASAADDWVVYTARRSVVAPGNPRPTVPGLLSVVVRNHTTARLQLLDQTIFSIACQAYRPVEIVLVTQSREPDAVQALTAILERHRRIEGYEYQVVSRPSAEDIRGMLLNLGVEVARGQYLAFLDDDDVVYPHHYTRLIGALRSGTAAWSASRTRRALFTFDASGALYCKKKDLLSDHEQFSLPDFVRDNYIPSHAYVLDRERLGQFPIGFSEQVNRCEDYIFLLRLVSCFRPIFLPDGPSCEYRIRDDGSNTNMMAEQPEEVRVRERTAWLGAQAVKDSLKRSMQILISMGEYDDHLRHAHASGREAGIAESRPPPPPLRHRIADRVNDVVKLVVPGGHSRFKALAARLRRADDGAAKP